MEQYELNKRILKLAKENEEKVRLFFGGYVLLTICFLTGYLFKVEGEDEIDGYTVPDNFMDASGKIDKTKKEGGYNAR